MPIQNSDRIRIKQKNLFLCVAKELTNGNQLFFRDNIAPMIKGKQVLILAASVTTGYTFLYQSGQKTLYKSTNKWYN